MREGLTEEYEKQKTDEKICQTYAKQCLDIKNDIYNLMKNAHSEVCKKVEEKIAFYTEEASTIRNNLSAVIVEGRKLIEQLYSGIDGFKDEMREEAKKIKNERLIEVKEFNRLEQHIGQIDLISISIQKKMEKLELYIKNDRFHDIVDEINKLEERFSVEAMAIVQNRMKKKTKRDGK